MSWATAYYHSGNTHGYTQEELDALNLELCDILATERASSDDTLSQDETDRIIKLHMDNVAKR